MSDLFMKVKRTSNPIRGLNDYLLTRQSLYDPLSLSPVKGNCPESFNLSKAVSGSYNGMSSILPSLTIRRNVLDLNYSLTFLGMRTPLSSISTMWVDTM